MGKYISVFTTTGSKKEAEKIAKRLLEDKLAGCVQILPVVSMYRWKGNIEKAREYMCIIKTKKALYKKIEKVIKKIHSYEIPEIIAIPISSSDKDYLDWLEKEI